jgi:hypothetical protein
LGHVRFLPAAVVRPAEENDRLYRPVNLDDPEIVALGASIRANGLQEPLVLTRDYVILSGHRRFAGCKLAGLAKIPCRIRKDLSSTDPEFLPLLRECNRQRVKTVAELLREEVVSANPEEAYRRLVEHRQKCASVAVNEIELGEAKRRARITAAKRPFLDAILRILEEYRDSRPLSVRQVHYYLLNAPPLIHARKPASTYRNNLNSYKSLDELLTRARLAGEIPLDAIHDPTRPVVTWKVFPNAALFIRSHLDGFLKAYYRDLMQSQPNHVEIIGEKNTIDGAIRSVSARYTIPYTIGRGYASLPPRAAMAERFRRSGKEQLILLVLSDFDPEGEDIGRSFAQSMRDDFGIDPIVPVKVALTAEQVEALDLPPILTAKETSSRSKGFIERHGENVFELEALPPTTLQQYLRDAIDSVLDLGACNAEIDREKQDAADLDTARRQFHAMLGDLGAS